MERLKKACRDWPTPVAAALARSGNPFQLLVSTLLSLRTRDADMERAYGKLIQKVATPEQLLGLSSRELEKILYPIPFYKTKAKTLKTLCRDLVDRFEGKVPGTMEELLSLKGVGRKTANLVHTLGFGGKGICVDTHVHRICNRWGYVETATPDQTEAALRDKLPTKYWKKFNEHLVAFGQNICKPISPICSQCCVEEFCEKWGVKKRR